MDASDSADDVTSPENSADSPDSKISKRAAQRQRQRQMRRRRGRLPRHATHRMRHRQLRRRLHRRRSQRHMWQRRQMVQMHPSVVGAVHSVRRGETPHGALEIVYPTMRPGQMAIDMECNVLGASRSDGRCMVRNVRVVNHARRPRRNESDVEKRCSDE